MKNNNISQTALASLDENRKQSRAYKALPSSTSRVPSQRPAPQTFSKKQRKTEQVTKEWTSEATHADKFSSQLPAPLDQAGDLSPKKIQRFHIKKTRAVLQKMKELHEKAQKSVTNQVSVSEQPLENGQDELWRDMMKPHEERHFRIGNVTNFFT
jgi:hypothetical protein